MANYYGGPGDSGLVDIGKGKGKGGCDGGKNRNDSWDTWDSWDAPADNSWDQGPPKGGQNFGGGGGKGRSDSWDTWDSWEGNSNSNTNSWNQSTNVATSKAPGFGGKAGGYGGGMDGGCCGGKGGYGQNDGGKGGPNDFGKGSTFNMFGSGKGKWNEKKPAPIAVPPPAGSPGNPKGKLDSKGGCQAGDMPAPRVPTARPPSPSGPATFPPTPPPPTSYGGKGPGGLTPPGSGKFGCGDARPTVPGRDQFMPAPRIPAPRLPGYGSTGPCGGPGAIRAPTVVPPQGKGNVKGGATIHPPNLVPPASAQGPGSPSAGLGNALAAVAGAAARGAWRPPTVQMIRPASYGGPPAMGQQPQAMSRIMPAPPNMMQLGGCPGMPAPPTVVGPRPHVMGGACGSLSPELAALVSATETDDGPADGKIGIKPPEVKPRIYLLITRLAPELEDQHMQQILEQCGEVQAWRRGKDPSGTPLSFGFVLFGDPEAAWKASTCVTKLSLCGQEVKVLVEESAELLIQKWRTSQQAALKVATEEELSWELERKSVSCRAQIDATVEEIYGPAAAGEAPGAGAFTVQRKQELREREQARVDRANKRKAWRLAEFTKEKERVESAEKRLRKMERAKDDEDRIKESSEVKAREDAEGQQLAKIGDDALKRPAAVLADNKQLCEAVDRIQSEPRDGLFKMELDVTFLRNERVLETKLRPWLERKIELFMGGPQSDLVEYVLRRVNATSHPEALIADLTRYLDDSADMMVERMWRMLAFELMRGGLGLFKGDA